MDQDVIWGLIIVMSFALVIAVIRSIRMSVAKARRLNEKRPSAVKQIDSCPAGAFHNFPAAKRGRTVRCRDCPKTFTRR